MEPNLLSVTLFANIFSQSVGCLFILFVSFAVQKFLSLPRSHLFILVFISINLRDGLKKTSLQTHTLVAICFSWPWSLLHKHTAQCFTQSLVSVAQSSLTFCDPMDHSPPGSPVPRILHPRILEWVAVPSFRGSFQLRDWTYVSYVSPLVLPGKPSKCIHTINAQ